MLPQLATLTNRKIDLASTGKVTCHVRSTCWNDRENRLCARRPEGAAGAVPGLPEWRGGDHFQGVADCGPLPSWPEDRRRNTRSRSAISSARPVPMRRMVVPTHILGSSARSPPTCRRQADRRPTALAEWQMQNARRLAKREGRRRMRGARPRGRPGRGSPGRRCARCCVTTVAQGAWLLYVHRSKACGLTADGGPLFSLSATDADP